MDQREFHASESSGRGTGEPLHRSRVHAGFQVALTSVPQLRSTGASQCASFAFEAPGCCSACRRTCLR